MRIINLALLTIGFSVLGFSQCSPLVYNPVTGQWNCGSSGGAPATNPTGGANNYAAINGQTFTGAISAPGITDSTATAGQVWYGGTGGVRTSSANLTTSGSSLVASGIVSSGTSVQVGQYLTDLSAATPYLDFRTAGKIIVTPRNSTDLFVVASNIGIGPSNTSLGANTTLSVLDRTALKGTSVYFCSDNNGDTAATTCQVTIQAGGSQSGTAVQQFLTNSGTVALQVDSSFDLNFGSSQGALQFYTSGITGNRSVGLGAGTNPYLGFVGSARGVYFTPTAADAGNPANADANISRDSAGIIDFGTGAQGSTAGSWKATAGATVAVATSALKTCTATTGTPWRAAVNDATAPALGVALTGGGTVFALVHCSLTTGTYIVDGL